MMNRYLHLYFSNYVINLRSNDLLEYLKRTIFNMILTNSVDNSNGIYEYAIDSEIVKIERLLFKIVFKAGGIFWI
jgi:hypothetical protein